MQNEKCRKQIRPFCTLHFKAPRMYRSTNRRKTLAEPEVWFRIVHMALKASNGAPWPPTANRRSKSRWGPRGPSVPPPRGKPKPPREPKTPRVVELLRKALEWEALIESGEVPDQAAIARREGITRARVTQVMSLLRLDSEIRQHILSMPDAVRRPAITERALRPIAQLEPPRGQLHAFEQLIGQR